MGELLFTNASSRWKSKKIFKGAGHNDIIALYEREYFSTVQSFVEICGSLGTARLLRVYGLGAMGAIVLNNVKSKVPLTDVTPSTLIEMEMALCHEAAGNKSDAIKVLKNLCNTVMNDVDLFNAMFIRCRLEADTVEGAIEKIKERNLHEILSTNVKELKLPPESIDSLLLLGTIYGFKKMR